MITNYIRDFSFALCVCVGIYVYMCVCREMRCDPIEDSDQGILGQSYLNFNKLTIKIMLFACMHTEKLLDSDVLVHCTLYSTRDSCGHR